MYVRVFDKPNNRYYKSIAYCIIGQPWNRQYLVLNPNTNCFELVDAYNRTEKESFPLVEHIQFHADDWVSYEKAFLLKYKQYCKTHGEEVKIDFLWGYRDVCENYAFLCQILKSKSVPVGVFDIGIRTLADAEDWHYILTQNDADDFMKLFVGFHDSTLDRLVFEEKNSISSATTVFNNSEWYGIVEICFEQIEAINIRPFERYYTNEIFEATLIIKDETVFWADAYMENEDLSYDGTYIKALSMKWRKIG